MLIFMHLHPNSVCAFVGTVWPRPQWAMRKRGCCAARAGKFEMHRILYGKVASRCVDVLVKLKFINFNSRWFFFTFHFLHHVSRIRLFRFLHNTTALHPLYINRNNESSYYLGATSSSLELIAKKNILQKIKSSSQYLLSSCVCVCASVFRHSFRIDHDDSSE